MPLDTPGPTAEACAPKPIERACCGGNCQPKPAPSAQNPRGCCTGSLIGEIQHAISSTSASSEVPGAAHSATATNRAPAHAEPFSSADPSSDLNSLDRFDDPAFRSAFVQDLGGDTREANLALEGVRCVQCVGIIEGLPRLARGVIEARLDMRRAVVRLRWNDAALPLSAIVRTLAGLGYTAHPLRRDEKALARKREDRGWLVRLAVAAACSGNAMLLALALYAGLFTEMDPAHKRFFEWISVLITAVSLAWPGAIFFRNAWAAITARRAHIDVPIAIALAAGGLWSAATLVRGHGEIYCDTVTVLVFALLVGRFLQHRQQRWTADSVELLFSLMPARARRVLPSGALEVIESHALTVGDLVEVRAGESFPADGDVVSGRSSVDQSFLTGESRPVSVAAADHVHAGAMNINATLRVRVLAHGDDTRVARLMRLVEESAGRRAPILAFADRAASWFVVGMLGLAAITLALWWSSGVGLAVEHAIALLVVTCPCALGIATPITLSAALGKAARRGVLIKGGDAIQKLAAPSLMLLDKTGTLTHGALSPLAWHGDSSLVGPVAAIEASATHPAALALASLSPGAQAHHDVRDLSQIVGSGITASVDGTPIAVGSWAFARSLGAHIPSDLAHLASSAAASGHTPIFIVRDGQAAALAILGDRVREDARPTLDALRAAGWRIGMISGDHPGVVGSVASQLDIPLADARAETTPEEKVRAVREAARAGTVVMVGDGVNDAAALAAADVGIAVHGGAEASLAAADIYLSQPGVGGIKKLVDACSRTMRVIRRGLYISAAYNIAAGGLAMSGLMSPIVAALVMPLSSLTVTIIALRSRTFD
jgi:Cu2+-exporting ATPase